MRFELTIDCEGAAFKDDGKNMELADLLEHTATLLRDDDPFRRGISDHIIDANGNRCGSWRFVDGKDGAR